MDTQHTHEEFHFTYSAAEQEELKRIRKKYLPPEENPMQRLRALDAGATRKGTALSLILGVLGVLIFGSGMSMIMELPQGYYLPGILLGILGLAAIAAAYPFYHRIVKHERKKIAPEILRLTDELMK